MWLLYQLAYALLLALVGPILWLTRRRHYRESLPARLGRQEAGRTADLWIHAVSVGEVSVAATLVPLLADPSSLVVTTVTPTGQARARAAFPEAATTYLPLELGFAIRRFLNAFRPRALVLSEGDYWPHLLFQVRRRSLPVVVVNGRVSGRSFARMLRVRPFLGALFDPISAFGVQTEVDRDRLIRLGVDPKRIAVTGNLKFEFSEPPESTDASALIRDLAQGRKVILAGSTMPAEEAKLLSAFDGLDAGRVLLVVAPRHPERWDRVAARLERSGRHVARRSRLPARPSGVEHRIDVLLLDSMGELAGLYRLADIAFIGGTLVPTGGHNPLEAARFGVPVTVGPSMENFHEIAEAFEEARAWRQVADETELGAVWSEWVDTPAKARATGERGLAVFTSKRGALERTRELLRRHLPKDLLA